MSILPNSHLLFRFPHLMRFSRASSCRLATWFWNSEYGLFGSIWLVGFSVMWPIEELWLVEFPWQVCCWCSSGGLWFCWLTTANGIIIWETRFEILDLAMSCLERDESTCSSSSSSSPSSSSSSSLANSLTKQI